MSLFKNIHTLLNRESQNHGATLHAVEFCSMGRIPGQADFPRCPGGVIYHKDPCERTRRSPATEKPHNGLEWRKYIKKKTAESWGTGPRPLESQEGDRAAHCFL